MKDVRKSAALRLIAVLLPLLVSLPFMSCQKKTEPDQNTIAIVGKERVSLEEFRNSYETDPSFPAYLSGEAGLREYLDFVIDKNLSEKLAANSGLLDNPLLKKRIDDKRKQEMIHVFYRREVAEKVALTEGEERDAFRKMGVVLHVKHLFAPDEISARSLYNSLKQGVPFDTLSKQVFQGTNPQTGGADLGEVTWGDLDMSLEETAFRLTPGQYSQPVRSKWGYHILLVANRKDNLMLTESEFQARREQIRKILRSRKEEIAAGEYLKNYLDPFKIKVKSEAFRKVTGALGILDEDKTRLQFRRMAPVTDDQIGHLKTALRGESKLPFMTSEKEVWTIGDFVEKLENLPPDSRPQLSSVKRFRDDIGIMIRNEFLLEAAGQEGLEHSGEVDAAVQRYARDLTYYYFLEQTYRNFRLPADVAEYYRQSGGNGPVTVKAPANILPGMNSPEAYKMYYSKKELHQRLLSEFPGLSIRINGGLLGVEAGRINWDHPVRMFAAPFPN